MPLIAVHTPLGGLVQSGTDQQLIDFENLPLSTVLLIRIRGHPMSKNVVAIGYHFLNCLEKANPPRLNKSGSPLFPNEDNKR